MFICVEGLLASAITVRGQGEVKVETLQAGQHFGEGSIFKVTSRSHRHCRGRFARLRIGQPSSSRCSMCGKSA